MSTTYNINREQAEAIAFRAVQKFAALCDKPNEQPNLSFRHVEMLRKAIADCICDQSNRPSADFAIGLLLNQQLFPACHHSQYTLRDGGYECTNCGMPLDA